MFHKSTTKDFFILKKLYVFLDIYDLYMLNSFYSEQFKPQNECNLRRALQSRTSGVML